MNICVKYLFYSLKGFSNTGNFLRDYWKSQNNVLFRCNIESLGSVISGYLGGKISLKLSGEATRQPMVALRLDSVAYISPLPQNIFAPPTTTTLATGLNTPHPLSC